MRILLATSLLLLTALARAEDTPRDATRMDVGVRYCFHDEPCLKAVRQDVVTGRPIQWVIYSLGVAHYADSPANAERAYDAVTRALTFAYDFLSEAELGAGQTRYAGNQAEALRDTLGRYATVCENRTNWLSKYLCIKRRVFPLLPDQYRPVLVPIEQLPN